jgi:hypothetical protein
MARGTKSDAGISKTDAVKDALAKLGKKAKPGAISEYVKSEYGLEISLSHVSNIKSTLKRSPKKRRGRPALNGQHEARSEEAALPPRNAKKVAGIDLDDVQAAKALTRRLGASTLHTLVDLLAQ